MGEYFSFLSLSLLIYRMGTIIVPNVLYCREDYRVPECLIPGDQCELDGAVTPSGVSLLLPKSASYKWALQRKVSGGCHLDSISVALWSNTETSLR